jgi:hypothetical protein
VFTVSHHSWWPPTVQFSDCTVGVHHQPLFMVATHLAISSLHGRCSPSAIVHGSHPPCSQPIFMVATHRAIF